MLRHKLVSVPILVGPPMGVVSPRPPVRGPHSVHGHQTN